jgi:hypothetical protein
MADKYIALNTTTGLLQQVEATDTGGSGKGGKIVALRSDGTIDQSMLPNVGSPTVTVVAGQNLAAGDFVNIHYDGSNVRVRKANAVDATAPAHGFVLGSVNSGSNATVYVTTGLNTVVPRGSMTAADVGKRVYLSASTAGAITLTPPSTAGNVVQHLGVLVGVDTINNLATVAFVYTPPIVV